MKKIFLFCMMALVAMCGLNSCSDDCNHDFIEYDNTKNLVGTWTYVNGEQAEAMVIKADGSFAVTGVMKGGALYEEKGTIKVVNNKVSLVFDGDTDVIEGRLELVAGKSLSIVINEEYDVRLTYDYCKEDLSDEIVGMWVCNSGLENDMVINTFAENGKSSITTFLADENDYVVNKEGDYMVIGNLLIKTVKGDSDTPASYIVIGLDYMPNGTELGDIMTMYLPAYEAKTTFLRINQSLDLNGKTYAYSSAYVTNAKGADEEFSMLGHTFNMANIKASDFDVIFGSELYCVGLNANSIKHKFRPNGQDVEVETPITVEGNKVTLDMSAINPACRKVEMYMFQDADDSQLHIYMPTSSFVNYFANLGIPALIEEGKLDPTDATAVEKVYTDMEARIESINVSFVLKALK